jgi:hypothetical protein
MITQKGAPSLAWWPTPFDHVLGDARLRGLKPELEQFAVNGWRAPKRIFDAHPPDQYAQLRLDPWSPFRTLESGFWYTQLGYQSESVIGAPPASLADRRRVDRVLPRSAAQSRDVHVRASRRHLRNRFDFPSARAM